MAGRQGGAAGRLRRRRLNYPAPRRDAACGCASTPARRKAEADAEYEALRALDEAAREADGIPRLEAERDAARAGNGRHRRQASTPPTRRSRTSQRNAPPSPPARTSTPAARWTRSPAPWRMRTWRPWSGTPRERPSPRTTRIVADLKERSANSAGSASCWRTLSRAARKQQDKLEDLARLRRDMKRERMDRPGGSFGDGAWWP
jgi:hypothetical protein